MTGHVALSRIGLGTAQFGSDYGIFNRRGKIPRSEAAGLLATAADLGVTLIDTAHLYGESESVVGRSRPPGQPFRIVTKTPIFPEAPVGDRDAHHLAATFRLSLERLNQPALYSLLVHHGGDIVKTGGERLVATLEELKGTQLVEKIGVSVYGAREIDAILKRFTPDIVQLPVNLADQRLVASGHLRALKAEGVEIHARSLFLQGALLLDPCELPPFFSPVRPYFKKLSHTLQDQGLSRLEACLLFGLQLKELDYLIIGVTERHELEEVCSVVCKVSGGKKGIAAPTLSDERFLNPTNWITSG